MKTIPLTQGKVAVVDDCDYDYLMQWKWGYDGRYARRREGSNDNTRIIRMHQAMVDAPLVDHIDGDRLNNTRANLRAATRSQNGYNRGKTKSNTSGYKGVGWHKAAGKWAAFIQYDKIPKHLGLFKCKHEAARAYNNAALELHGEFARLNIIQEPQPVG